MSGWDKPSRPTWDPQDGPEDGTQAFPAPDGSGADDRWSQPVGSGWGGTGAVDGQDFGRPDFGASDFGGVNTSGADLGGSDLSRGDLGRAERREPAFPPEPNGFAPDRNGFPPDRNGFPPTGTAPTNGFPPEPNGFAPDRNGFPGDQNGFPRGGASSAPPSDFFPQEFEQRQPGATLAGRQLAAWPGQTTCPGLRPPPGTSRRGRAPPARNPPARSPPVRTTAAPASTAARRVRPRRRLRPSGSRPADFDRPGRPGPGLPPSRPGPGRLLRLLHVLRPAGSGRAGAPRGEPGGRRARRPDGPGPAGLLRPDQARPPLHLGAAKSGRPAARPARPRSARAPVGPGPGWSDQEEQPPRRGDGRGPQRRPAPRGGRPVGGPGRTDGPRAPAGAADVATRIEPASQGQADSSPSAPWLVIVAAGVAYLAAARFGQ